MGDEQCEVDTVVPYVGTWIEITRICWQRQISQSRSLRGNVDRNTSWIGQKWQEFTVVPYVGTWIEMSSRMKWVHMIDGRSLRGNVDRNYLP